MSLLSTFRYLNSPVTFDLKGEILKAANTLLNFTRDNAIEGADSIPKDLIAEAKGLAFVTFVKVCVNALIVLPSVFQGYLSVTSN